MMLVVKINTENAAFDYPNVGPECARILRKAADEIEGGVEFRSIFDINGNEVGYFDFVQGTHTLHDNAEGLYR